MKIRALVTGITGQDGAFLSRQLLDKGYDVYGIYRRVSSPNFWRLAFLGIDKTVHLVPCDILDASSVFRVIKEIKPNVIYHLAGQSQVLSSFDSPIITSQITGLSVTNFLEAILQINKKIKFYNAATSELYGNAGTEGGFDECTSFRPESPYAVSKLYGYWMVKVYRNSYGLFASNGILFNHESEVRGLEFVTRKITNEASKISLGLSNKIVLGNIDTQRDWGYAPEYTKAMQLIMEMDEPEDYVVATGETHSVREFLKLAFESVNLDFEEYLSISNKFMRPMDVLYLKGSFKKINNKTGWRPKSNIKDLVRIMMHPSLEDRISVQN